MDSLHYRIKSVDDQKLLHNLKSKLSRFTVEVRPFGRGPENSIWVEANSLIEIGLLLKDDPDLSFDWLEIVSCMEMEGAIAAYYFIRSTQDGSALVIRTTVDLKNQDKDIVIPSVIYLWPMAQMMEQEAADLFGIHFSGSAQVRR